MHRNTHASPNRRSIRPLALLAALALAALLSCGGPHRGGPGADTGEAWSERRAEEDRLVVRLLETGRFAEALALADSMIAGYGEDARLLGQKAHALASLGKSGEAVPLFERAIIADYASCENHLNFAVLLMRMGKTGRAITEFREAKRFCGAENMAVIHRNLAVAEIELGDRDEALASARAGLRYSPKDPYLLGLAGMLVTDEDPVEAESLFVRAERAGGLEPSLRYRYGLLLLNTGRSEEAATILEEAADGLPDDRGVRLDLAEALIRSGRPREAESILRGLRDGGDDPEVTRRLARSLFAEERFAEALDLFRELPETPETLDRIAMSLFGLGRLEEAAAAELRSLETRPDWTVSLVNYAVILAARGELEEARTHLERALEIDPANESARRNLELLEEAMRKAGR